VDIFAFYGVKEMTSLLHSNFLKEVFLFSFWLFSIGLISSILVLKYRLDHIPRQRKHLLITSLYGITVLSFIPKLVFVIAIAIIYFSNYNLADYDSNFIIPIIGLLSGFLPFFMILYAIFRSLYNFRLHQIKLEFDDLPGSFHGLRIIHISDTHLGSFNFRYHIFERAVKIINNTEPDLILFSGDLVNNFASELEGWEDVFKQLKATQGKYAVLGNHDYGDYFNWKSIPEKEENFNDIKSFFGKIGFKLLLNDSAVLEINSEQFTILGVENWGHPPFKQYGDLQKAMKNIPAHSFKILLSHDPSHWPKEVIHETNIRLTLSGHTHGMQAGINLRNKSWSPIQYKYKHWAGLYKEGNQYLYVNRGLGWLGFPGRLGMRPEITLIEFARTSAGDKN
jgi:predicted MPP superfamily phosphohydrolase